MARAKLAPLGIAITSVAIIATAVCVVLGTKYEKVRKENDSLKAAKTLTSTQVKIVDFGDQFVSQVLKADSEVSFDTRLKLENNVRDIGDEDILAGWKTFTDSTTETDAQNATKNLLELFFQKLK